MVGTLEWPRMRIVQGAVLEDEFVDVEKVVKTRRHVDIHASVFDTRRLD
jgi:hypothetical protein